ncbi:MAG: hypothetical protein ACYC69_04680 [Thermodesulfovibrionales bacterium]
MKKTFWFVMMLVFVVAVSFSGVWAEEKKDDSKKEGVMVVEKKHRSELQKKATLLLRVVAYGEAEKDPIIMLSAVKILDDLPFKGIRDEKSKDGVQYDRESLLAKAKEFAADDAELLALIAKVKDAPEVAEVRGRHRGHRDRWGHGRGYYGGHHYYERRHHERFYDCFWRLNRHGDWVCR